MSSRRAEQPVGHQCLCVVVLADDDDWRDRCNEWVPSPDQPVCDKCSALHAPLAFSYLAQL